MTGGFGNKRGANSSDDYQREWDTLVFIILGIIAVAIICWVMI